VSRKKIILIATGGTIASTGRAKGGDLNATLKGEDLIHRISDFTKTGLDLEVINFSTINSTSITPVMMVDLAKKVQELLDFPETVGLVVTHGTSLMEETAFVLDTLIESDKPVVMTGSQLNASHPWSDGTTNLNDALFVAASPASRGVGVVVVFCGKIHEGRAALKKDTAALNAFTSGEIGLLGRVHYNQVFYNRPRVRKTLPIKSFTFCSVAIIPFYSGADERYIKAAVEFGEKGIIVEGVGLGNVNSEFFHGIKIACDAGCQVIITTRSPYGRLLPIYAYKGGGVSLVKAGVLFSSLPSPKARLLLMLALGGGYSVDSITELLN